MQNPAWAKHVRMPKRRHAFLLGGGIKIVYDLALLFSFRSLRAEHEVASPQAKPAPQTKG